MASATYRMVHEAVQKKLQVLGTYNGLRREMCQHTLGISKKGAEQALFYQFSGESSTGLGPDGDPSNWRCIPLDRLSEVTTRTGAWHTAPNHSRPQTCVAEIDVEASQ